MAQTNEWEGADLTLTTEILRLESQGIDVDEIKADHEHLKRQFNEAIKINPLNRERYAKAMLTSLLSIIEKLPSQYELRITQTKQPFLFP